MENDKKIYEFCEKRWDHYERKDNGYYPSKHDSKVLEEAGNEFGITSAEVEKAFNSISAMKANLEVLGLTQEQKLEMARQILKGNKETPWGQGLED